MSYWPRQEVNTSTALVSSFSQSYKSWVDWLKLSSLFKTLSLYPAKPPTDPWNESKRRYNQVVACHLQPKDSETGEITGSSFVVATYHMPCAFWSPPVMTIHAALVSQFVQKLKRDTPTVLMGDFNFKPSSGQYELMLRSHMDESSPDYPQGHERWTPHLPYPWRSAYNEWYTHISPPTDQEKEAFEKDQEDQATHEEESKEGGDKHQAPLNPRASLFEPDFTNYAEAFGNPVFIDTLDYIFISGEWEVEDVIALPHRSTIEQPMPNDEEPSDHIKIGTTLSLP
jgi:endonuclease/exonuclease/phosphatase family metal-dependent hydrolase